MDNNFEVPYYPRRGIRMRASGVLCVAALLCAECALAKVIIEDGNNASATSGTRSLRITGDVWSQPAAERTVPSTAQSGEVLPGEQTYDEALGIYARALALGDQAKAITLYQASTAIWKELAGKGDPKALVALGWLAARGLGQPLALSEAEQFARQADLANNPFAECLMATVQAKKGNDEDAKARLKHATELGSAFAANELGILDEQDGKPHDAENWYRLAAQAGSRAGAINLGRLEGLGSPQAAHDRFVQLRSEAEQGDSAAMYMLALLYHTGRGVLADYSAALAWYQRASDRNSPNARKMLSLIYSGANGNGAVSPERMKELAQPTMLNKYNLNVQRGEMPRRADLLTGDLIR